MNRKLAAPSAATDSGDNRDLRSYGEWHGQSACVTHTFVSHKNIHVLANFSGFRQNSVTQPGVCCKQTLQSLEHVCAIVHFKLHGLAIFREPAEGTRDIEGDPHYRRFRGAPLFVGGLFRVAEAFTLERGLIFGGSSIWMMAALTHVICGSPSTIFFQVFPSSLDA